MKIVCFLECREFCGTLSHARAFFLFVDFSFNNAFLLLLHSTRYLRTVLLMLLLLLSLLLPFSLMLLLLLLMMLM